MEQWCQWERKLCVVPSKFTSLDLLYRVIIDLSSSKEFSNLFSENLQRILSPLNPHKIQQLQCPPHPQQLECLRQAPKLHSPLQVR